MSKTVKNTKWNSHATVITNHPPVSNARCKSGQLSQIQVVAACVNGDNTVLGELIPYADAELPGLFAGTGPVMGFAEESIHASALRVLHKSHDDVSRDEPALASSAFALGFVVAARLFGGVR